MYNVSLNTRTCTNTQTNSCVYHILASAHVLARLACRCHSAYEWLFELAMRAKLAEKWLPAYTAYIYIGVLQCCSSILRWCLFSPILLCFLLIEGKELPLWVYVCVRLFFRSSYSPAGSWQNKCNIWQRIFIANGKCCTTTKCHFHTSGHISSCPSDGKRKALQHWLLLLCWLLLMLLLLWLSVRTR